MRCVVYNAFGVPAEVLHLADRPVPDPGPGEIRVRMVLSPIHNHDLWTIRGDYGVKPVPEDGTDTVPGVRSNVFAQSVVLTRIMDYWGAPEAYRSFCLMRSSTPALARSAPARTAFPMSASFGK